MKADEVELSYGSCVVNFNETMDLQFHRNLIIYRDFTNYQSDANDKMWLFAINFFDLC